MTLTINFISIRFYSKLQLKDKELFASQSGSTKHIEQFNFTNVKCLVKRNAEDAA